MRSGHARLGTARLPRDLHPVAWWLWALGLAAAASFTTNPYLLLLLIGVACLAVAARRSAQPWADSFRLYLWLGVAIVVIRVLFRILLGGDDGGRVLVDLPAIPLPHWTLGLRLLGPVSQESVLAGLYDGLRLAAIVICVGSANALANPKRLLRSVPSALYEIGSALVVAVTVLPQLAESLRRVRAAQLLRGSGDTGRVRALRRLLIPVLEDSLERSLALAAGMDTRGYGRTSGATPRERRTTGGLMLLGMGAVAVGVYGGLDSTTPAWLGPVPRSVERLLLMYIPPNAMSPTPKTVRR
jgi:energy-coupling factor transport system permease protein